MKWLTLAFLGSFLALFIYVSLDLPDRADPDASANDRLPREFVELNETKIEIPNLVTAVLADFRSYDTLGETLVIFTAGLAVLLVLMRGSRNDDRVP